MIGQDFLHFCSSVGLSDPLVNAGLVLTYRFLYGFLCCSLVSVCADAGYVFGLLASNELFICQSNMLPESMTVWLIGSGYSPLQVLRVALTNPQSCPYFAQMTGPKVRESFWTAR